MPSPHKCEKTGLPILCGACRACKLTAQVRQTKLWFPTCSKEEQLRATEAIKGHMTTSVQAQFETTIQTALGKDAIYASGHRVQLALDVATCSGSCRGPSRHSLATEPLPPSSQEQSQACTWVAQADPLLQVRYLGYLLSECHPSVLRTLYARSNAENDTAKRDPLSFLPEHLAKYSLSFLSHEALNMAASVSPNWRRVAKAVLEDREHRSGASDFIMDLQAACDPTYEAVVKVRVSKDLTLNYLEKNVFCGACSVMSFPGDVNELQRVGAFDEDGVIATGASNKLVRVWDATSGQVTRSLVGHAGSVKCVLLTKGSRQLVSGGYDTSIRVWDVDSGKCTSILQGHSYTVNCLARCDDVLASGSKDCTLRSWDLKKSKATCVFQTESPVLCVVLTGDRVLCGTEKGSLGISSLPHGKKLTMINIHRGAINDMVTDEHFLVTAGEDRVATCRSLSNLSHCRQTFRHTSAVNAIQSMNLRLITGAADGKIRIWNLESGENLRILRGNSSCDPICSLKGSIDGRNLYVNTTTTMHLLHFSDTHNVKQKRANPTFVPNTEVRNLRSRLQRTASLPKAKQPELPKPVRQFSGEWRRTQKLSATEPGA